MKIVKSGKKYVLYNDRGRIIIITSYRRICERIMEHGT